MTIPEFLTALPQVCKPWHLVQVQSTDTYLLRTYSPKLLCPIEALARHLAYPEVSFMGSGYYLSLSSYDIRQIANAADCQFTWFSPWNSVLREKLLAATGFRPIAHLS